MSNESHQQKIGNENLEVSQKKAYPPMSSNSHQQKISNENLAIMSNSQDVNPLTKERGEVKIKIEDKQVSKRMHRRVPTSWEEASPEDRMMISMRLAGEGWLIIRTAWEHMTGTEVGASTLSTRYRRIIKQFTPLAEGDGQIARKHGNPGGTPHTFMFIQAEVGKMTQATASDCEAVRGAVLGAVLEAVDEAVDKATGKHLDEAADEHADE